MVFGGEKVGVENWSRAVAKSCLGEDSKGCRKNRGTNVLLVIRIIISSSSVCRNVFWKRSMSSLYGGFCRGF